MNRLWPVSDRVTRLTEGLRIPLRPAVAAVGGVGRPAPNTFVKKRSQVLCVERISLRHVAGVPAFFEPFHPLGRGAVGEGVGDDKPLSLFL
jgi:hypothetical protein